MGLARFQRTIVDTAGNVMPLASVEVRDEATGNLAALFSDRAGTVGIANPMTATVLGFAAFHVTGGAYKITATSGALTTEFRYEGIGTASEYDVNEVSKVDYIFGTTGLLGDAEALPAIPVSIATTLLAGLAGSYAKCITPPTGSAVFTFRRSTDSGATFTTLFSITFSAGARVATFNLVADVDLNAGDLVRIVCPATHDATLAGFSASIMAAIT